MCTCVCVSLYIHVRMRACTPIYTFLYVHVYILYTCVRTLACIQDGLYEIHFFSLSSFTRSSCGTNRGRKRGRGTTRGPLKEEFLEPSADGTFICHDNFDKRNGAFKKGISYDILCTRVRRSEGDRSAGNPTSFQSL